GLGLVSLVLPRELAVGDIIAYVKDTMETEDGMNRKYTFSGSVYFERMKNLDLYTTNIEEIEARVEKSGLSNVFLRKLLK
ncbi:MAG: FAD-dependent oxidoreductase, partial [Clostridiales bacterium]|nr:FAD-dependent oxidoreductase [Clostridiales bacterium]